MPNLSGKRIAVIGATGFVGTHLVRRLLRLEADVFLLSRQRPESEPIEDHAGVLHYYPTDMAKPESISAAISEIRPDVVFHSAAARSEQDWRSLISVNVMGSMTLLEACAKVDGLCFINFGSSLEMLEASTSIYGASRSMAASFLLHHAREWSVDLTHIRTGNVYGPGMSSQQLIPTAIRAGLDGTILTVTPDDVKRNYVEVDDLIDAGLAALETSVGGVRVVNAVCSDLYSARDVASIVAQCLNRPISVEPDGGLVRAWDRFDWAKDTRPAQELLGWQTRVPFPEGVARVVKAVVHEAENGLC